MGRRKSRDFIPEKDSDFASMARNFAVQIARDPGKFFISSDDSAMITRRAQEFRDALAVATAHSSRTKCTIVRKNEARDEAERIIRRFGNMIRVNPEISAVDKMKVQVKERPKCLGERTCPQTAPMLSFIGSIDGDGSPMPTHVLRFRHEFGLKSRARPEGAARLELFVELIDPTEPVPRWPGELGRPWYLRSFTRSPMKVKFPMPTRPMKVLYWGRWANATGEVGEWSKTLVTRVEGWHDAGALEDKRKDSRVVVTLLRRELPIIERPDERLMLECDTPIKDEPRALPDAA